MSLNILENILIDNQETRPFLADAFYKETDKKLPLIIFAHGYKGYKNWGAWDLMAKAFAEAGFFFVKFNFSHNGTTIDDVHNFVDLEAFGHNNYSKEMSDLNKVIDYFAEFPQVNASQIILMGHSRGNGNIVLQAAKDSRINALIGLAGVSDYASRFPKGEVLEQIKKAGVFYIENKRTHQQMPHYYQFFEDFILNETQFDISKSAKSLEIPYLIIHGTKDETVALDEAKQLNSWAKQSELCIIENADHSFGMTEPWTESQMPTFLEVAVDESVTFLRSAFQ